MEDLINNKIWYDLVHSKFGDEYLILYLDKQKSIRKIFKIATILFSATGIFSAFNSFKIPTIIACIAIGVVQCSTSIENFIIHSEKDLEELGKLRLLYYERTNKLEELWSDLQSSKLSKEQATTAFFALRQSSKEIEDLDNNINVRSFKKLRKKANILTNNYLTTYYYE
jgi:hypothetical protein